MILIVVPVLLMLVFLILGLIWFTPEFRANILFWQGKREEARKIYECILRENPEKVGLYRKLAQIYCMQDRCDRKAIKVFEIILKLKVRFQWEDQIVPAVARHYIAEGRKDSEAIRLMEKAVKIELERVRK